MKSFLHMLLSCRLTDAWDELRLTFHTCLFNLVLYFHVVVLNFNDARDDGVTVASFGPYTNNLHHARERTMPAPHHSIFYRPDALPDAKPTVSGIRKSIHPVKHSVMRCWHGYLSEQGANDLYIVQLMPLLPHHLLLH